MSMQESKEASEAICARLQTLASIKFADAIFSYLPLSTEVDLIPLMRDWIDESRTVAVPLTDWEHQTMRAGLLTSVEEDTFVETRHRIREPAHRHYIPTDWIAVILVPGIGFSTNGNRLGRGGGFYDRFLDKHRPPIVLGIAFDEQMANDLHVEEHDQQMTAIVTPTRTLLH